jgi:hypothetical protein
LRNLYTSHHPRLPQHMTTAAAAVRAVVMRARGMPHARTVRLDGPAVLQPPGQHSPRLACSHDTNAARLCVCVCASKQAVCQHQCSIACVALWAASARSIYDCTHQTQCIREYTVDADHRAVGVLTDDCLGNVKRMRTAHSGTATRHSHRPTPVYSFTRFLGAFCSSSCLAVLVLCSSCHAH